MRPATSSCAQLNSGARQDVGDEGAFSSRCIRAAALAMFLCKAQLERLVLGRACLFKIAHAGHHVDDRLGSDARNRGGPDVMNASLQPWRENALEQLTFYFEATRPLRVVGDDCDGLVRHESQFRSKL